MSVTPAAKTVELPNGVNIPFVEQGPSAGIPVLFLPGYTDSWRSYQPVLTHLPSSIHAFALTLTERGHEATDHPTEGYSPHDIAVDLAAFLDFQNLESAIFVGHSMSAAFAERFALDFPKRTRGLVLIGAPFKWRRNPAIMDFLEVLSALTDPIDPEFVRGFQESTMLQPIPPAWSEPLEMLANDTVNVPARVWRGMFQAFLEADFSDELSNIKTPTLILWGDQDTLLPRGAQDELAATIAGSQLVVYPGAGHSLHWDEPQRFAADLVTFSEGPTR